ncbi:Endonuclease/exonuclease/phosphatase [Corchorus capsularis]|uniref:Endonuclease/exonuclease/phosphatase n=1 Tax=Corchorus capsularis TaxID=210143 RepID=A0A1R3HRY0_COCAP|nr:Endonuclease/exonuclease/phosphatase [Corchorus capsularis]
MMKNSSMCLRPNNTSSSVGNSPIFQPHLTSPLLTYHLRFNIGRANSLLQLSTITPAFEDDTDLTAIYYNARGAALFAFRAHLQELVNEYRPMIIIMTETKLGIGEAHQLASALQYNQVMSAAATRYYGGIWLFSDLRNFSLEPILQGDNQITVNLLKV